MQRCDPRPLNPNGELLLGISSAGLRSSGSIGSGARTLTYIPMAKGFLYLVVRVVTYSIDVETGI